MCRLLDMGLDVFTPLIDHQGIDFVLRYGNGRHIDVQVKSRNKDVVSSHRFNLSKSVDSIDSSDSCYYIFCTLDSTNLIDIWIMSPEEVKDIFPKSGQTGLFNTNGKSSPYYEKSLNRFLPENIWLSSKEWQEKKKSYHI